MALLAKNLVVVKKFTLSSFNCINLYTRICIPRHLSYSCIHNDVALGGIYQIHEKKVGVVSIQNLDIRNKSSDEKEQKTLNKVAVYSGIQKVYGDLLKELSLKETDSKLEQAVKYILSKDIQINEWNTMYSDITSVRRIATKKSKILQVGRFTPYEEEEIIKKWNGLCSDCGIENPLHLLNELKMKVSSKDRLERKQLNVIGCYLDPDLKKARHATEVVYRAIFLLNKFVTGKFKPEEDKIILQEVERKGDNAEVFKDLCLMLNRNPIRWDTVRIRYICLLQSKDLKFGTWTIDEDKFIIEKLFMNKELEIATINLIGFSDYKNFQEIKRNAKQVRAHYEGYIKPILLSYHYGKLDYNWKYDFLCYVVENKFTSVKEISWKEVLKLLPYQTRESMNNLLTLVFQRQNSLRLTLDHSLGRRARTQGENLYLVVQREINDYKENVPTQDEIEYRSQIVKMYLNCKK